RPKDRPMKRADAVIQLLGPALLVVVTGLLGTAVSLSTQTYFISALVNVAIVVALYLFIGNSGVLSFGHISFVAVGAWAAGVLALSSVPATTGLLQATVGATIAIVAAFVYQRTRYGRLLRAARDDVAAARAVGISVYRQRLIAFALSGALAGLAGGLYIHLLPLGVEDLYLDLTFITLAMLVIGGVTSLLGAVVGALAVSGVNYYLANAENGGFLQHYPGTHLVVVGAFMAIVLVARPSGLTGGRELSVPRLRSDKVEP